ncbi:MAG: ATPase [Eubacterium sp.]|nr:ATPase [Eubacterium sp.]
MSSYKLTGKESLGVEFGSTRIKAVLVDEDCNPVASGSYTWENKFENGVWTYPLSQVWEGLQAAYAELHLEVFEKTGEYITELSSIGISAMMHGYLPFDKDGNQLAEFRTWRNTITADAAEELTKLFNFNIPQRWSIAHLYQAILNNEEHVKDISMLTTLAGYVHYKLCGENVLGVGEASGMFPIDSETSNYNEKMLDEFSSLKSVEQFDWKIRDILPEVKGAGNIGGVLTDEGARLIDPSGRLQAGVIMCPPEGDAGTGMVATNSVTARTGNVSAGTSIFSMIVLEKPLSKVYEEIDIVTTPTGKDVAMVHCNNCCTDLDYWVNIFDEFSKASGNDIPKYKIYDLLYEEALKGDEDCAGLVNFNYLSGEPVTHTEDGVPMFVRSQGCKFNLANFFRAQIYSTMSTLKIGMKILENEGVEIDKLTGHGGLFKTPVVGQKLMAGAMNAPVSVMETAGEGGAWGIAVLARYSAEPKGMSLEEYLDTQVFSRYKSTTIEPDKKDVDGFNKYIELYEKLLEAEKTAYKSINL